jgi:hypothetical protein
MIPDRLDLEDLVMSKEVPIEGLAGQWILVSGDDILAHDPDLIVILEKAKEFGEEEVSVRKVLAGQACYY